MKTNDVLEHLGVLTTSFVFDLSAFIAISATSVCVPSSFDERSSPLRRSRKVMRSRVLFRSIWGSKRQPFGGLFPTREAPQVGKIGFSRRALGNQPLGRLVQSARADYFNGQPGSFVKTITATHPN